MQKKLEENGKKDMSTWWVMHEVKVNRGLEVYFWTVLRISVWVGCSQ
jgi:hypothetical protein